MKALRIIFLIFLLETLLTGCCPLDNPDSVPYRVVTQVDVVYENGAMQLHRQYFQEENIRPILDYLRFVDPYGTPRENPEQLNDRKYEITLTYSDGSQFRYQQRADRFLRIGDGPWKCIDPRRALYLSGIVGMIPGEIPAQE
ncbi:MAG: hypothetical protein E7447_03825 [Ruminococcaceae bacterium]|nr:hypothetical protein [Oscillospiraceae bacterium]